MFCLTNSPKCKDILIPVIYDQKMNQNISGIFAWKNTETIIC